MSPKAVTLAETLTAKLMMVFTASKMVARKWLVDEIRRDYPHLVTPRLDLIVGILLNGLVDHGTLQRVQGRFYAPGKRFCKETP